MRSIRSIAVLTGLVAGLALTGSADPALARPASQPAERSPLAGRPAKLTGAGFRVAASRHFGEPGNASGYSVIVSTGRRQAWAFGGTNPGGTSAPVAERWNGRTLTQSRLPPGLRGFINAASAPSARDVWAASEYGHYVLHWNGTSWRLARRFAPGPITGLTAISATDVWVFGTTASGAVGAGTWRFDGHRWARGTGRAASIYRASAISRRDIWAISAARSGASVVRFNGRYWRRVPTGRVLAGLRLHDILAVSAASVWLLGYRPGTGGVHPVLVHWDGSDWTRITARMTGWPGLLARGPAGSVLVTATSADADADATGLILPASTRGFGPAIAIRSPLGTGVSDVALGGSPGSLWAAGGILTRLGGDAVLWEGQLTGRAYPRDDDD